MSLTLSSSAFDAGGEIPARYTCDGEDVSPPLSWTGVPKDTKSLVLVVEDPDAPDPRAPMTIWAHWVVYNIPPTAAGFAEGASPSALPDGAVEGMNDWHRVGYGGPCPPVGRHRYFHRLWALDALLQDLGSPTREELHDGMQDHVLDRTELVGTYQRS